MVKVPNVKIKFLGKNFYLFIKYYGMNENLLNEINNIRNMMGLFGEGYKRLTESDLENIRGIIKEQSLWQDMLNSVWSTIYSITRDNPLEFELCCNKEVLKTYSDLKLLYDTLVEKKIIDKGDNIVQIRGKEQKLYVTNDGTPQKEFKVSTGAAGFSNTKNSGKTPLGLCYITKEINADEYEIIIGGKGVGKTLGPTEKSTYREGHCAEVLTASLVLQGAEKCNQNVRDRYVYIHGTNREQYLGQKKSGGCIRVSNDAILELTNILGRGTYVYITNY